MPFFKNWASRQASSWAKRLRRLFGLLVAVPSRGISRSSLPRSGLPLAPLHSRAMGALRGAMQPPRVRTLVLPLPAPIPLRSWLDFGRRIPWHRHPIGPGLHRASHLRSVQRASGFFPTRPHGAWPDCLAPPHLRAVAFGLRLLLTCSAEDLAGLVHTPELKVNEAESSSGRLWPWRYQLWSILAASGC